MYWSYYEQYRKQICLKLDQSEFEGNGNEAQTLGSHGEPELEPYHRMQVSIIHMVPVTMNSSLPSIDKRFL